MNSPKDYLTDSWIRKHELTEKTCNVCGIRKNVSEFYVTYKTKLGFNQYNYSCKLCVAKKDHEDNIKNRDKVAQHNKEYQSSHREQIAKRQKIYAQSEKAKQLKRASNERMRMKYPEKHRTRQKSHYLLRMGVIKKTPCQICGNTKSEMHHPDYSDALKVMFLCKKHHTEYDKKGTRG